MSEDRETHDNDSDNGRNQKQAEETLKTLQTQMQRLQTQIVYSLKYSDEQFDYRWERLADRFLWPQCDIEWDNLYPNY